jgi:hypothetical protein
VEEEQYPVEFVGGPFELFDHLANISVVRLVDDGSGDAAVGVDCWYEFVIRSRAGVDKAPQNGVGPPILRECLLAADGVFLERFNRRLLREERVRLVGQPSESEFHIRRNDNEVYSIFRRF